MDDYERFTKKHKLAIRRYCRENQINIKQIKGVVTEEPNIVRYYLDSKLVLTAQLIYKPIASLRFNK